MTFLKPYQKVVAGLVAVCFLTSLAIPPPLASAEPTELKGISSASPSFVPMGIPAELASIEEVFIPRSGQDTASPLIHIQSVHSHPETQRKIYSLLKFLDQKYGIQSLFIEGAGENLDPAYFQFFDDNRLNVRVAEKLIDKGELTGAELFLVESDKKIPAYGLEDPSLYQQNLTSFQSVMMSRDLTGRFTQELHANLDRLETHLLRPEARRLLRSSESFDAGHLELLSYLYELERNAKTILGLDLRHFESQVEWPQLIRILRLQEIESKLEPEKIQSDREQLIGFLKKAGVEPVLVDAFQNLSFSPYQSGMVYDPGFHKNDLPRYLAERLVIQTKEKGFSFEQYPYFTRFLEASILQSELDAERLFREIEKLDENLTRAVSPGEDDWKLVEFVHQERLIERLFDLELTAKDYAKIRDFNRTERPLVRFLLGIESLHAKTPLGTKKMVPENIRRIESIYGEGVRFYQLAKEREETMASRILSSIPSPPEGERDRVRGISVLITGGFHTEGLSRIFREKQVPYTILSPRITEKVSPEAYISSLLGEKKTAFDTQYLEPDIDFEGQAVLDRMRPEKFREAMRHSEIRTVLEALINAAASETREKRLPLSANQLIDLINKSRYAGNRRFYLKRNGARDKAMIWDEETGRPLPNLKGSPVIIPFDTLTVETPVLAVRSVQLPPKELAKEFGLSPNLKTSLNRRPAPLPPPAKLTAVPSRTEEYATRSEARSDESQPEKRKSFIPRWALEAFRVSPESFREYLASQDPHRLTEELKVYLAKKFERIPEASRYVEDEFRSEKEGEIVTIPPLEEVHRLAAKEPARALARLLFEALLDQSLAELNARFTKRRQFLKVSAALAAKTALGPLTGPAAEFAAKKLLSSTNPWLEYAQNFANNPSELAALEGRIQTTKRLVGESTVPSLLLNTELDLIHQRRLTASKAGWLQELFGSKPKNPISLDEAQKRLDQVYRNLQGIQQIGKGKKWDPSFIKNLDLLIKKPSEFVPSLLTRAIQLSEAWEKILGDPSSLPDQLVKEWGSDFNKNPELVKEAMDQFINVGELHTDLVNKKFLETFDKLPQDIREQLNSPVVQKFRKAMSDREISKLKEIREKERQLKEELAKVEAGLQKWQERAWKPEGMWSGGDSLRRLESKKQMLEGQLQALRAEVRSETLTEAQLNNYAAKKQGPLLLQFLMKHFQVSAKTLAEEIVTDPSEVEKWLSGEEPPKPVMISWISNFFVDRAQKEASPLGPVIKKSIEEAFSYQGVLETKKVNPETGEKKPLARGMVLKLIESNRERIRNKDLSARDAATLIAATPEAKKVGAKKETIYQYFLKHPDLMKQYGLHYLRRAEVRAGEKSGRSRDGEVRVDAAKLSEGNPAARVQNLQPKDSAVFRNVDDNAVLNLHRLPGPPGLELNVKGIGRSVKFNLQGESTPSSQPVGRNQDRSFRSLFIDHLKDLTMKAFLDQPSSMKSSLGVVGVGYGFFDLFGRQFSLTNPSSDMSSVVKMHTGYDNSTIEAVKPISLSRAEVRALALGRKVGEQVLVANEILITLISSGRREGGPPQVKLGFQAPPYWFIVREEIAGQTPPEGKKFGGGVLVLSRTQRQHILFQKDGVTAIRMEVDQISPQKARLIFEAPREIPVFRTELVKKQVEALKARLAPLPRYKPVLNDFLSFLEERKTPPSFRWREDLIDSLIEFESLADSVLLSSTIKAIIRRTYGGEDRRLGDILDQFERERLRPRPRAEVRAETKIEKDEVTILVGGVEKGRVIVVREGDRLKVVRIWIGEKNERVENPAPVMLKSALEELGFQEVDVEENGKGISVSVPLFRPGKRGVPEFRSEFYPIELNQSLAVNLAYALSRVLERREQGERERRETPQKRKTGKQQPPRAEVRSGGPGEETEKWSARAGIGSLLGHVINNRLVTISLAESFASRGQIESLLPTLKEVLDQFSQFAKRFAPQDQTIFFRSKQSPSMIANPDTPSFREEYAGWNETVQKEQTLDRTHLAEQSDFARIYDVLHSASMDFKAAFQSLEDATQKNEPERVKEAAARITKKGQAVAQFVEEYRKGADQKPKEIQKFYLLTSEGEKLATDPEARKGMRDQLALDQVSDFLNRHPDEPVKVTRIFPKSYEIGEDDNDLLGIKGWESDSIVLNQGEGRAAEWSRLYEKTKSDFHDLNWRKAVLDSRHAETGGRPVPFRALVIESQGQPLEIRLEPVLLHPDLSRGENVPSLDSILEKVVSLAKDHGAKDETGRAVTSENLKAWLREGSYGKIRQIIDAIYRGIPAADLADSPSPETQVLGPLVRDLAAMQDLSPRAEVRVDSQIQKQFKRQITEQNKADYQELADHLKRLGDVWLEMKPLTGKKWSRQKSRLETLRGEETTIMTHIEEYAGRVKLSDETLTRLLSAPADYAFLIHQLVANLSHDKTHPRAEVRAVAEIEKIYPPPAAFPKTIGVIVEILNLVSKNNLSPGPETEKKISEWAQAFAQANPDINASHVEAISLIVLRNIERFPEHQRAGALQETVQAMTDPDRLVRLHLIRWWTRYFANYLNSLKEKSYRTRFAFQDQRLLLSSAGAIDPKLADLFQGLIESDAIWPTRWEKLAGWKKALFLAVAAVLAPIAFFVSKLRIFLNALKPPQFEKPTIAIGEKSATPSFQFNQFFVPAGLLLLFQPRKFPDHYDVVLYNIPNAAFLKSFTVRDKTGWVLSGKKLITPPDFKLVGFHVRGLDTIGIDLDEIYNMARQMAFVLRPDLFSHLDASLREEGQKRLQTFFSHSLQERGEIGRFDKKDVEILDHLIHRLYQKAYESSVNAATSESDAVGVVSRALRERTFFHEAYHLASHLLHLRERYQYKESEEELMSRLSELVEKGEYPTTVYHSLIDHILHIAMPSPSEPFEGERLEAKQIGYEEIVRITGEILDAIIPGEPPISAQSDAVARVHALAQKVSRFDLEDLTVQRIADRAYSFIEKKFGKDNPFDAIGAVTIGRPLQDLFKTYKGKPPSPYAVKPHVPPSLVTESLSSEAVRSMGQMIVETADLKAGDDIFSAVEKLNSAIGKLNQEGQIATWVHASTAPEDEVAFHYMGRELGRASIIDQTKLIELLNRIIPRAEVRVSELPKESWKTDPALVEKLRSPDESVRKEAIAKLWPAYSSRYQRFAEDQYYIVKYFMEEIVGIPLYTFGKDEFYQETLINLHRALSNFHRRRLELSVHVKLRLIIDLYRMLAKNWGTPLDETTRILQRLSKIVRTPKEGLENELRLNREQVVSHLREQIPQLDAFIERIKENKSREVSLSQHPLLEQAVQRSKSLEFAEGGAVFHEFQERLEEVLQTLSSREKEIVKLRYGIGGNTHTLEEVARLFNITHERVRQIEARAIWKLKQPVQSRQIEGFLRALDEPRSARRLSQKHPPVDLKPIPFEGPSQRPSPKWRPMNQKKEKELIRWAERRLSRQQKRILPYVLEGWTPQQLIEKFGSTSKVERQRLITKLRMWFTFGMLDSFGSYEQVTEKLKEIYKDSSSPQTTRAEVRIGILDWVAFEEQINEWVAQHKAIVSVTLPDGGVIDLTKQSKKGTSLQSRHDLGIILRNMLRRRFIDKKDLATPPFELGLIGQVRPWSATRAVDWHLVISKSSRAEVRAGSEEFKEPKLNQLVKYLAGDPRGKTHYRAALRLVESMYPYDVPHLSKDDAKKFLVLIRQTLGNSQDNPSLRAVQTQMVRLLPRILDRASHDENEEVPYLRMLIRLLTPSQDRRYRLRAVTAETLGPLGNGQPEKIQKEIGRVLVRVIKDEGPRASVPISAAGVHSLPFLKKFRPETLRVLQTVVQEDRRVPVRIAAAGAIQQISAEVPNLILEDLITSLASDRLQTYNERFAFLEAIKSMGLERVGGYVDRLEQWHRTFQARITERTAPQLRFDAAMVEFIKDLKPESGVQPVPRRQSRDSSINPIASATPLPKIEETSRRAEVRVKSPEPILYSKEIKKVEIAKRVEFAGASKAQAKQITTWLFNMRGQIASQQAFRNYLAQEHVLGSSSEIINSLVSLFQFPGTTPITNEVKTSTDDITNKFLPPILQPNYSIQPNLVNVKKVYEDMIDWLIQLGYPHPEVLKYYRDAIVQAEQMPEQAGGTYGTPMWKIKTVKGRAGVQINVRMSALLLTDSQRLGSKDFIVMVLGGLLIREAWGFWIFSSRTQEEERPFIDQAIRVLIREIQNRRIPEMNWRNPSEVFRKYLNEFEGQILESAAFMYAGEFYEDWNELQGLEWVIKKGLLNINQAEIDLRKSKDEHRLYTNLYNASGLLRALIETEGAEDRLLELDLRLIGVPNLRRWLRGQFDPISLDSRAYFIHISLESSKGRLDAEALKKKLEKDRSMGIGYKLPYQMFMKSAQTLLPKIKEITANWDWRRAEVRSVYETTVKIEIPKETGPHEQEYGVTLKALPSPAEQKSGELVIHTSVEMPEQDHNHYEYLRFSSDGEIALETVEETPSQEKREKTLYSLTTPEKNPEKFASPSKLYSYFRIDLMRYAQILLKASKEAEEDRGVSSEVDHFLSDSNQRLRQLLENLLKKAAEEKRSEVRDQISQLPVKTRFVRNGTVIETGIIPDALRPSRPMPSRNISLLAAQQIWGAVMGELPIQPLLATLQPVVAERPYAARAEVRDVMRAIVKVATEVPEGQPIWSEADTRMAWNIFEPVSEVWIEQSVSSDQRALKALSPKLGSHQTPFDALMAKTKSRALTTPGATVLILDRMPSRSELRASLISAILNPIVQETILAPGVVATEEDQKKFAELQAETGRLVPDGRANLVYAKSPEDLDSILSALSRRLYDRAVRTLHAPVDLDQFKEHILVSAEKSVWDKLTLDGRVEKKLQRALYNFALKDSNFLGLGSVLSVALALDVLPDQEKRKIRVGPGNYLIEERDFLASLYFEAVLNALKALSYSA